MALRKRDDLEARAGIDRVRRAREGAGALTYAAVVIAAVVVVGILSASFRTRWDLSAGRDNSLSPLTLQTLAHLSDDVTISALFTEKHPRRQEFWELLELYRRASPRIRFEFIDPVGQPGRVKQLGVSLEQAGSRRDGVAVVARGDRKRIVRGTDEESLTNAVVDVGSAERRVVGFLRGYAEADPEGGGDTGLSAAVEALRAEYYDVRSVVLSEGVPPEVRVLVIAGPRRTIPAADLATLEAWLLGGGHVLAMLDPGADQGLGGVLEKVGLRLTPDRVLDPQSNQNRTMEFVRVVEYSRHEIVRGFGGSQPTAFPIVGAVVHFEPGDPAFFHDALLKSTAYAVSVTPDGHREQGPFDLGAASWKRLPSSGGAEREIRAVLVGDADFATNAYLPLLANRNLFLNAVAWLAQAEGLVAIRKQPLEGQTILLEVDQIWIMNVMYFGAPLLVVVAGIVVYLRRRRL